MESSRISIWSGHSLQLWRQQTITSQPVKGWPSVAEIAALEFKLDVDALPALRADLALGFAVGESGLNGLDNVAEFSGNEGEEKDDALFVDGLVAEAAEVDGVAVGGPIF